MMIDTEILKRVRIFTGLDPAQLSLLLPILKLCQYKKGDYILRDDSHGDTFFLLVDGKVRVTKELVKGIGESSSSEKVLATLDAELLPVFGENGILGHAPRTANVIAFTDCSLYSLSKADFDTIALTDSKVAYHITMNIAQVLSDRLKSTDDNLVKLATALYIAVQQ